MYLKNTMLGWDPVNMKVTHCDEADRYIRPVFREGWTLSFGNRW